MKCLEKGIIDYIETNDKYYNFSFYSIPWHTPSHGQGMKINKLEGFMFLQEWLIPFHETKQTAYVIPIEQTEPLIPILTA